MVLKITAERDLEITEPDTDAITVHVASTVHVSPTARIFTLVTSSDFVLAKWLKQVLKRGAVAKTTVLVGVAADTDIKSDWYNPKKKEFPYQRLLLSAGSHALIYTNFENVTADRAFVDFFQNPKVFAVGRDMANISRRLKVHHAIEIRNAVDLNELAAKGLRREDLDLRRYDLDGLAKAVLGKEMDVLREYDLENDWWTRWDLQYEYRKPKWFEEVKFSAVDVHLCFMIGLELIDAIDGAEGLKKKAKKKNK